MSEQVYKPPLDQLLTYGEPDLSSSNPSTWADYRALGLTHEHVPGLIQMATDRALHTQDSDNPVVWAPLHAWRALGQLRAEEAIQPLIPLFHEIDDDWLAEELPEVFGLIGPAAVTPLGVYLADTSHDWYPRAIAAESLAAIGQRHPESRDECVAVLTKQLERFKTTDPGVNGLLIGALVDLKAVESASVIRRAFSARCVDEMIMGDWQDVRQELGLVPPAVLKAREARPHGAFAEANDQQPGQRKKRKAKRKQAAKSRKRNRRR
jgi:hypothetical protein